MVSPQPVTIVFAPFFTALYHIDCFWVGCWQSGYTPSTTVFLSLTLQGNCQLFDHPSNHLYHLPQFDFMLPFLTMHPICFSATFAAVLPLALLLPLSSSSHATSFICWFIPTCALRVILSIAQPSWLLTWGIIGVGLAV